MAYHCLNVRFSREQPREFWLPSPFLTPSMMLSLSKEIERRGFFLPRYVSSSMPWLMLLFHRRETGLILLGHTRAERYRNVVGIVDV